jgi:tetratricopeptide (TPR) repeat protein
MAPGREAVEPGNAAPRFSSASIVLCLGWIRKEQAGRGGVAMVKRLRAYDACTLAAALVLLGTVAAKAADDAKICTKESGDVAIDACSRAIQSKRYSGHVLARLYLNRGVERRAKEDYDAALADFADAVKADKKYADAYFNRCSIYNFKKAYDSAITECGQAIKLGPSADTTVAGANEKLGKDAALSDYYTERGFAYFKKDDYAHAFPDLDNAIRLNPNNGRALKTRGLAYEAKGDSRAQADLASAKLLGE